MLFMKTRLVGKIVFDSFEPGVFYSYRKGKSH